MEEKLEQLLRDVCLLSLKISEVAPVNVLNISKESERTLKKIIVEIEDIERYLQVLEHYAIKLPIDPEEVSFEEAFEIANNLNISLDYLYGRTSNSKIL